MKISISNIAWERKEDDQITNVLEDFAIRAIDIAPSKVWADPSSLSDKEVKEYRRYWQAKGINIIALQSLLYNKPKLLIFKDKKTREQTLVYLRKMIKLACRLGVKYLIFGSPKNRQRGKLTFSQAMEIAIPFFYNWEKSQRKMESFSVSSQIPQRSDATSYEPLRKALN